MRYIFFLLPYIFYLPAITNQELFLQAHDAYSKKDYAHALKSYDKISKKGASVWYNMGNCAYKNNDMLHALLYWHKAQGMGDARVAHDSSHNSKLVLQKLSLPVHGQKFPLPVPLIIVQILFLITFSVFLLMCSFSYTRFKKYLLIPTCICACVLGIVNYKSYRQAWHKKGMVMSASAPLYAGPDNGYHQVAALAPASLVTILDQRQAWIKVCTNGHEGWIESKEIEII